MIMKLAVGRRFIQTFLFPESKEVYYIGGADVLPAPLGVEEENTAISELGTEREEEAKKLLIEHNLRLVVYIAKKFDNTGIGVEDLISIGTIGLIKSIQTFNPNKNIKLAIFQKTSLASGAGAGSLSSGRVSS